MSTTRRRSLLIDQKVQGAIIVRCVIYWFYCLLTVTVMLFGWTLYHGPPRSLSALVQLLFENYAPALGLSLILLPIVIVDVIRFSQSFVGPVHHLRCSMHRLAQGERVETLVFRDNDFWSDMAESFNSIATKVQSPDDNRCRRSTDPDEDVRKGTCQVEEQAV